MAPEHESLGARIHISERIEYNGWIIYYTERSSTCMWSASWLPSAHFSFYCRWWKNYGPLLIPCYLRTWTRSDSRSNFPSIRDMCSSERESSWCYSDLGCGVHRGSSWPSSLCSAPCSFSQERSHRHYGNLEKMTLTGNGWWGNWIGPFGFI